MAFNTTVVPGSVFKYGPSRPNTVAVGGPAGVVKSVGSGGSLNVTGGPVQRVTTFAKSLPAHFGNGLFGGKSSGGSGRLQNNLAL